MDFTTEVSTSDSAALAVGGGIVAVYFIICIAVSVLSIIAMWKLFNKAGEAGWKAIIPIYNAYILFKIVYGNGLKFLLLLIPIFNFVVLIAMCFRIAQVYGKSAGWGAFILFLEWIALPILAFSKSTEYKGPVDSFI